MGSEQPPTDGRRGTGEKLVADCFNTHLVGVDTVIRNAPCDSTKVHRQRNRPVHSAGHRRPAEQRPPIERETWCMFSEVEVEVKASPSHCVTLAMPMPTPLTKHDLRVVCHALHEWVDGHEREG